MIAKTVSFRNFRNIEAADIDLSPGVNVFLGNNAEGKTNALEGIYLMAAARSFRTSKEREMVRFGEPFFDVTLRMEDERRQQELSFRAFSAENGGRRECRKNGVSVTRIAEMVGVFRAVLFCPEHLAIVKAGPGERRSFLDIALCQLRPVYLKELARYNRLETERNAALKQFAEGTLDRTVLEVLSEQTAEAAAYLYMCRREFIERLNGYVARFFEELSADRVQAGSAAAGEVPELRYKNSLKLAPGEKTDAEEAHARYLALLKGNVEREAAAGTSLYGSHKDDIEIFLDGHEARFYASQGQQRSLALAMKLAEGEISREMTGEYPVFLFDDVLSELDPARQSFLLSKLGARQVVMTACTPPPVDSSAHFFRVEGGRYTSL